MKTSDLNRKIDDLVKKQGINEYRIERMSLKDGNYMITPEGKLVREVYIQVIVLPTTGLFRMPITFNVKNE